MGEDDGNAVDHLDFRVVDLEATAADLRAKGIELEAELRVTTSRLGQTVETSKSKDRKVCGPRSPSF